MLLGTGSKSLKKANKVLEQLPAYNYQSMQHVLRVGLVSPHLDS